MDLRDESLAPPRVHRRDRRLHVSYASRYRIHCTAVYPLPTPNGSSIIIQGHDTGLSIFWRGGKSPKAEAQSNGHQDALLGNVDDERGNAYYSAFQEEEELDPDCPYPSIVQSLTLKLDTAVLDLAIPVSVGGMTMQTPSLLRTNLPVAAVGAGGTLQILSIPLQPPVDNQKDDSRKAIIQHIIRLPVEESFQQNVCVKARVLGENDPARSRSRSRGPKPDGELIVASLSMSLSIWRLLLTSDSVRSPKQPLLQKVSLSAPSHKVIFHPSSRSTQLLVLDRLGIARIYDPYAPRSITRRPTSRDSTTSASTTNTEAGRWLMAFSAPFLEVDVALSQPALEQRKRILDAQWILGGRGVLALLEDAAWGIWDPLNQTASGKGVEDFALQGFLSTVAAHESSLESQAPKRGSNRLAPMTPNTRKAKAENLFGSTPRNPDLPHHGGISVLQSLLHGGNSDESVALWYDSDVYTIPSTQLFYQRSSAGSGFGSLYAPGLTHVSDIDLSNERISSVNQFSSKQSSSSLGQMNTQRDLLISAEHRCIILESLRPQGMPRQLFQPTTAVELPTSRDQRMLDAGDLDLGGMDRVLNSMANGDGRVRKVGFAR